MQTLLLSNKISHFLDQQLHTSTQELDNSYIQQKIQQLRQISEQKVYFSLGSEAHQYFQTMWMHNVSAFPEIQDAIPNLLSLRSQNVYHDILSDRLSIQHKSYLSPFIDLKEQQNSLRHKLQEINGDLLVEPRQKKQPKDIHEIYEKLYSEDKIKQTEEFVKRKREQQLQIKRKRKLQKEKELQNELKIEEEQKNRQFEEKVRRKEEVRKKRIQGEARRSQQKMLRQKRKSEYLERKKMLDQKQPLFKKLEHEYFERSMKLEAQSFDRMHNERKYYLERFDSKSLGMHEKKYQQIREKRQKEREDRYAQMADQEKQRHRKFRSSYHIQREPDPDQLQKIKAKEKNEKIKQYRAIVRQKFQPRVDVAKRQQLANLIRDLQFKHKKVKKVLQDDGTVKYEVVQPINKKILGVGYLQSVKQLIAKSKQKKRKQDPELINSNTQDLSVKKKPIDYLSEFRNNRRDTKSRAKSDFSAIVGRRDISFDDKVKKVMIESQKISELTKLNEMRLKHGKFKTSQEILACKDQIDQSYLDIVNMKLKLLQNQAKAHKEEVDEEDSDL